MKTKSQYMGWFITPIITPTYSYVCIFFLIYIMNVFIGIYIRVNICDEAFYYDAPFIYTVKALISTPSS